VTGAIGKVHSSLHLNGSSAQVAISNAPNLQRLSVETWVRFDALDSVTSYPGQQYLVFRQNSRTINFEGFTLLKTRNTGSDRLTFILATAAGLQTELASTNIVTTNEYYHVVGTFDGTNMNLYVNGVLHSSAIHPYPVDYGDSPMFFGNSGTGAWYGYLAGDLDEVSLYDRALLPSEVAALYASGSNGKCASLAKVPVFQTPTQNGNSINLAWTSIAGLSYQVQYATNLTQSNWVSIGAAVVATNSTSFASDFLGSAPQKFYRVLLLP